MIDYENCDKYMIEIYIGNYRYFIMRKEITEEGFNYVKDIDMSLLNEYHKHQVINFFDCVLRIDNDLYLREDISEEDKNFMKQANEEYTKKFNAPLFKNSEILDTLQNEAS